MQLSASSSVEEVAAIVSDALTSAEITAVLSGGAAVQIYTSGLYESRDLDFVASASQRELEQVLNRLGFTRQAGRHFVHPTCAVRDGPACSVLPLARPSGTGSGGPGGSTAGCRSG